MLLELDQRVEVEPKAPKGVTALDGLQPAGLNPQVTPKNHRYAVLGLLLAILPAVGWYTWQTMRTNVRSTATVIASVPTAAAPVVVADVKPEHELNSINNDVQISTTIEPDIAKPAPEAAQFAPKRAAPKRHMDSLDVAIADPKLSDSRKLTDWSVSEKEIVSPPPLASGNIEKKPTVVNNEVAEGVYRQAVELQEQGRVTESHEKYRDVIAVNSRHIKARERLVESLLQQGLWAEAQQILYEGVAAVPDHYIFAQQLARLYVEQGNNEKALALLENSRQFAQSNAEYVGLLAAIYQRLGRFAQAREAYTQALSSRPLEGRWWAGLAIVYEAEKNWVAASDAYNRVRTGLNVDQKLVDYAEQRIALLPHQQ